MPRASLPLPITLAYAKGAYTVALAFGSERRPANLVLDTGSSTLVVLPHAYDPSRDRHLAATSLAQEVRYGEGAWAGPVLRSQLHFGDGRRAQCLDAAPFALVEAAAQDLRGADGIFGLAYRGLDTAHDFGAYLSAQGTTPPLTWPWPFASDSDADLAAFATLLHQQPAVPVTPLFSALAEQGLVHDRFALLIRRALVHVLDDDASLAALNADPLNRGTLVLGGGEESESLYTGGFQDVHIVHDLYYNANLIAVQVGDRPRIPAPALAQQYRARAASNAIIDTGSSFLVLEASLYQAVLADFAEHDPRLPALIARFQHNFQQHQQGVANADIELRAWPDLHFFLESANGGEVKLTCTPAHYWPRNALRAGQSYFLLMNQLAGWPNQSILGLPLLADRYCLFDRSAPGAGRLRVAQARPAS